MSTFQQTTDRDLALVNGELVLVDDIAQCAAIELQNKFLFGKGEYFLDTREGIPYFEKIFVKNPDVLAIRQLFRSLILATRGVKNVLELSVTNDPATRKGSFSFRAVADNGKVIIGGSGQPFVVEE